MPGKSNYLGRDLAKWHSNIPNYARVLYQDVYPGIDLAYYGSEGQLEYDWLVRPGADPAAIRIAFSGARRLRIDNGDLVVETAAGELRNRRPVVYQESGGTRRYVAASYVLQGGRQVRFRLEAYDRQAPLVIDPTLYGTVRGNRVSTTGGPESGFPPWGGR